MDKVQTPPGDGKLEAVRQSVTFLCDHHDREMLSIVRINATTATQRRYTVKFHGTNLMPL
jgi:hypothetical protein